MVAASRDVELIVVLVALGCTTVVFPRESWIITGSGVVVVVVEYVSAGIVLVEMLSELLAQAPIEQADTRAETTIAR